MEVTKQTTHRIPRRFLPFIDAEAERLRCRSRTQCMGVILDYYFDKHPPVTQEAPAETKPQLSNPEISPTKEDTHADEGDKVPGLPAPYYIRCA